MSFIYYGDGLESWLEFGVVDNRVMGVTRRLRESRREGARVDAARLTAYVQFALALWCCHIFQI